MLRSAAPTVAIALIFLNTFGASQIAQPAEKAQPDVHPHHMAEHHHLHLVLGEEKCGPTYTYEEGVEGPSHWPQLCTTGRMQAPIDIEHAEKLPITSLKFNYQPSDLDIINDCNQYRVLLKFPDNYWLNVGKRPYFTTSRPMDRLKLWRLTASSWT